MMLSSVYELEKAALSIRLDLLKLCTKEVIHIGGDLSITDVMTVLWQYQMKFNPLDTKDESRDRFVLSKGHASAVTSFNQAAIGCFNKEDVFNEYATDMGRFSMHSCNLVNPYVEVSTGSLGHGMPVACGMAAALRLKGNNISRVYTIMGDGEQGEGSIWEAAANAYRYKLGNLVAIVDSHKLEADGPLDEVTGMTNLAEKYKSFGWRVCELDGNSIQEIKDQFDKLPSPSSNVPTVFICHTIKGKGAEFMENQTRWHAGKITEEQYYSIKQSLESSFNNKWGNYVG